MPEHIWSKISGKAGVEQLPEQPADHRLGPFQTVEYKKSGFTRLVANKDYWKGAPKIDEVIFENYTNQDTMTMDLKAGNIDVAFGVPVAQFNALKSEPGITATAADQKYLVELAFNAYASPNSQANPVLQDVKFRQAVSWAVDKEKIVATCMGGYADVGAVHPRAEHRRRLDADRRREVRLRPGEGQAAARRRRLQGHQRRRRARGQAGQADQASPLDAQRVAGAAARRQAHRRLVRVHRHRHRARR